MSQFYKYFDKVVDWLGLLVLAAVLSILAWVFWHYAGTDALGLMSTVALIAVAGDNVRLRRKLRKLLTTEE